MGATQEENLDVLVELGFPTCPWEVTYYEFKGSTQLEKEGSPFNFYVGDDWVVGQYFFSQELEELRLIEDDIILLMFDNGLPFPDIGRNTDSEVMYVVGFKGEYAREIYEQLIQAEVVIQGELSRIPVSRDLAERNFEVIEGRFAREIEEALPPIGDIETYGERRAQIEECRKGQLVEQMSQLIKAVRDGEKVKYGTFIERIKALSPSDYDPHDAIEHILDGRCNENHL